MIKSLKKLFEVPEKETAEEQEHRVRLAAAALLVETARADFEEGDAEQAAMHSLLCTSLELPADEVSELLEQASGELDNATSLYDFTRVINDHYTSHQKRELIVKMWRVAYADGRLDKYEEALIRQVAELTYVPHTEYIRAKLDAKQ